MKTNCISQLLATLGGLCAALMASLLLCGSVLADATDPVSPWFKVQYYDTSKADNEINIFNPTVEDATHRGIVCEMIYVFDAHEEMQECCGCPTTNWGLRTISVVNHLTKNPLVAPAPTNGVIKIVTTDFNASTGPFAPCNPATITALTDIERPIPGWTTHVEEVILPVGPRNRATERDFEPAALGSAELSALAANCTMIHTNGTGHGICTCGAGDVVNPTPGGGRR